VLLNTTYYVNDLGMAGDVYTTAPGSDLNDGLSPSSPMMSLGALLAQYSLGAGDVVLVDAGQYDGVTIGADDEGLAVVGASVVGGDASEITGMIELEDADYCTIRGLTFLAAGSGIVGHGLPAVFLNKDPHDESFSTNNTIADNRFEGASSGITFDGPDGTTVERNTFDSVTVGVTFIADKVRSSFPPVVVRDNNFDSVGSGVYVSYPGPVEVHDNVIVNANLGISMGDCDPDLALVYGNLIYREASEGHSGVGLQGTAAFTDNEVYGHSVGILGGSAIARIGLRGHGNIVHDNAEFGIRGSGIARGNTVYNNSQAGIFIEGEIGWNIIYGNGLLTASSAGIKTDKSAYIHHNVIYGNNGHGILVDKPDVRIESNTIHSSAGDAIHADTTDGKQLFTGPYLLNNIIWAEAGYAFYVGDKAQHMVTSDYNCFWTTGSAKIAYWQGDWNDMEVWQLEMNLDHHSIFALPKFADAAAGDYRVLSPAGFDLSDSPTVDMGPPDMPFDQEPTPNGGRADIGAYANTPEAAASPDRFIQVLSPFAGDPLVAGSEIGLVWHSYGLFEAETVDIEFFDGTNWVTAASGARNDGAYGWTVPAIASGKHKLRIFATHEPAIVGSTGEFLIVPGGSAYYVNDDATDGDEYAAAIGSYDNTGKTPDSPLPTLSSVISRYDLGPADIIFVDTGEYVIYREITIGGLDKGVTVQGPVGDGHSAVMDKENTEQYSYALILDDADWVKVRNLEIKNAGSAIMITNGSTFAQVTGNQLHDNSRAGILFDLPDNYWTTVSDNELWNNGDGRWDVNCGIQAANDDPSAPVTVSNNIIRADAVLKDRVGIYLPSGAIPHSVIIEDNRIIGMDYGVKGDKLDSPLRISDNEISGGNYGIHVANARIHIDGNVIYDNATAGIYMKESTAYIHNNRIFSNPLGIEGVWENNYGAGPVIEGNLIYDNDIAGIKLTNSPSQAALPPHLTEFNYSFPFDATQWKLNDAVYDEVQNVIELTPDDPLLDGAGNMVFETLMPLNDSVVEFDFRMTPGDGQGMFFGWLWSEATDLASYPGSVGLPEDMGFAVEFDTRKQDGDRDPSDNHVALLLNTPHSHVLSSGAVPNLDSGNWIHVEICNRAGDVTVYLTDPAAGFDRALVLSAKAYQPNSAMDLEGGMFVIGASRGTDPTSHQVRNVILQTPLGALGTAVIGNTIYQTRGDALVAEAACRYLNVRNNVFAVLNESSVEGTAALKIADASQYGFSSDYNDFFVTNDALIADWQGEWTDLWEWQHAVFVDKNSLAVDPLFVDPDGADGILGYDPDNPDSWKDDDFHLKSEAGSYHGGLWLPDDVTSPLIDRASDADMATRETGSSGGYRNMGFEGNTPEAGQSPASNMLILAPNGGEFYPQEDFYQVVWRGHGYDGNVAIDISYDGGGTWENLASDVPDTGRWWWRVRGVSVSGTVKLRVSSQDVPAISDESDGVFEIVPPTTAYYVNIRDDADFTDNEYTTASGDDHNSGLDPAHPKASLRAILEAYDIQDGDVIYVDTSTTDLDQVDTQAYPIYTEIVISFLDMGGTIQGPTQAGHWAIHDRGNHAAKEITGLHLWNADDTTIRNIGFRDGFFGIDVRGGSDNVVIDGCLVMDVGGEYSGETPPPPGPVYPTGIRVAAKEFNLTEMGGETVYNYGAIIRATTVMNVMPGEDAVSYGIDFQSPEGWIGGSLEEDGNIVSRAVCPIHVKQDDIQQMVYVFWNEAYNMLTGKAESMNLIWVEMAKRASIRYNHVHETIGYLGFAPGDEYERQGIFIDQSANINVAYNTIYGPVVGVTVKESSEVMLEGNEIYGCPAGMFFNDANNITIQNNELYHNGAGMFFLSGEEFLVKNNVIYGNEYYGILTTWFFPDYEVDFLTVSNNTFYETKSGATCMYIGGHTWAVTAHSNIFASENGPGVGWDSSVQDPFMPDDRPKYDDMGGLRHTIFYSNHYWDGSGGATSSWGRTYTTHAGWYFETGMDQYGLWGVDPMFVSPYGPDGVIGNNGALGRDASDSDFHLKSEWGTYDPARAAAGQDPWVTYPGEQSPAIDMGAWEDGWVGDEPENNGNRLDMGAYGGTAQASKSPDTFIQLLLPRNFEKRLPDQAVYVRWNATSDIAKVRIEWRWRMDDDDPWSEWGIVPGSTGDEDNDGRYDIAATDKFHAERVEVRVTEIGGAGHSDQSYQAFCMAGPELTAPFTFYVDDDSNVADQFTPSAMGNYFNTGLYPEYPVAGAGVVPRVYGLNQDDVVLVDAGTYDPARTIMFDENDNGSVVVDGDGNIIERHPVTYRGATDPITGDLLSVIDGYWLWDMILLFGSQYIDLKDLQLNPTAVYPWAHSGAGVVFADAHGSSATNVEVNAISHYGFAIAADGVVVKDSVVDLAVHWSTDYQGRGIWVSGSDTQLINNKVHKAEIAYYLRGSGIAQDCLADNHLDDNRIAVLQDPSSIGFDVKGEWDLLYCEVSEYDQGMLIASLENNGSIRGNLVHHNRIGMDVSSGYARYFLNRIYANLEVGLQLTDAGPSDLFEMNSVFSNSVGILILAEGVIENSLVYSNYNQGVMLSGSEGVSMTNNTVRQDVGNALWLTSKARDTKVRSCIFVGGVGYLIKADGDSQYRFDSDYNLFWTYHDAQMIRWSEDVADPAAWYFATGNDRESMWADPLFVNPDGVDGNLGFYLGSEFWNYAIGLPDANRDIQADYSSDDDFHIQSMSGSIHGGAFLEGERVWALDPATSPALDAGDPMTPDLGETAPNGGRRNIGAFGGTLWASRSPDRAIFVTSPARYSKRQIDRTIGIMWNSFGTSGAVNLEYSTDGGSTWNPLAAGVPSVMPGSESVGLYQWQPETPLGDIVVRVSDAADSSLYDDSYSFQVNAGGSVYYIDDSSNAGDQYTPGAIGDNANSGVDPLHPMASLTILMESYVFSSGDIIYVDTGDYGILEMILLDSSRSGVLMLGPTNGGRATIDRNDNESPVFYIEDCTGTIVRDLGITGGSEGIFIDLPGNDVLIQDCVIFNNQNAGIVTEEEESQSLGNLYIRGNLLFGTPGDNSSDDQPTGLDLKAPGIVVEENVIHAAETGIATLIREDQEKILIRDNELIGAPTSSLTGTGIDINGPADCYFNVVHGFDIGIKMLNLALGRIASYNTVYGNAMGIGLSQSDVELSHNTVYGNSGIGIYIISECAPIIENNRISRNRIGIGSAEAGDLSIFNNLIYANEDAGINLMKTESALIWNNLILQEVGNCIQMEEETANWEAYNNILFTAEGFFIYAEADSQVQMVSNSNLFFPIAGGDAYAGLSVIPMRTLDDWRTATAMDAMSYHAVPTFRDPDGRDNIIGGQWGTDDDFNFAPYSSGIDHANSTHAPGSDAQGQPRFDDPSTPNSEPDGYADNGPNEFIGDSVDATPMTVTGTSLNSISEGHNYDVELFYVYFSEKPDLFTSTLQENYDVRAAGPDGLFGTADDELIQFKVSNAVDPLAVAIQVGDGEPLPNGVYRLWIDGSGVMDTAANLLDGDADGGDGGDFIFFFRVGNDAPTATGQSVSLNEDAQTSVILAGSDPDNDPITFEIVTPPQHGTFYHDPASSDPAQWIYVPSLDYFGTDQLEFRVYDGVFYSGTAFVNFTISPVNDAPRAFGNSFTIDEDQTYSFRLNAADPEGDPLTFIIISQPSHGTLTGVAPNLTYTPEHNYSGSDSFTFIVNDGHLDSPVVTATFDIGPVNDAPVAIPVSAATPKDQQVIILLLGNDAEGDRITYYIIQEPQHGTLLRPPEGTIDPLFTYIPDPGYEGVDHFTFQGWDGKILGNTAVGTVVVGTPPNNVPVATGGAATTPEDQPIGVVMLGSDADGDPLTYVYQQPAHGTLTGVGPGLIYTPDADFNGTDTFTFHVSDGMANSNTATFTIEVSPVNDAPTALNGSREVVAGTSVVLTLQGADIDGDALSYAVTGAPGNGVLSPLPGAGDDALWTYTPNPGFTGTDTFGFRVSDGESASATATFVLNVVTAPNSPPDGAIDSPAGGTVIRPGRSVNLQGTGTDSDGAVAAWLWSVTGPGGFAWTSNLEDPGDLVLNAVGNYTITLTVTDDDGAADPTPATSVVTVSDTGALADLIGVVTTSAGKVYIYDCDGLGSGVSIDGDYDETDGTPYNPYAAGNDLMIFGTPGGVVIVTQRWSYRDGVWRSADFSGLGVAVDGKLSVFADQRITGQTLGRNGDIAFLAADSIGAAVVSSGISGLRGGDLTVDGAMTIPVGAGLYADAGGINAAYIMSAATDGVSLGGNLHADRMNTFYSVGNIGGRIEIAGAGGTFIIGATSLVAGGVSGEINAASITTLYTGGGISGAIQVAGNAGLVYAAGGITGSIEAGSMARLISGADVDADLDLGDVGLLAVLNGDLAGTIGVARSAGSIVASKGDFAADADIGGNLSLLSAQAGLFRGRLTVDGKLTQLVAGGTAAADSGRAQVIADGGIGNLFVLRDMVDTDVGVGVRSLPGGSSVSLGYLYVGGNFERSNALAGVWNEPGPGAGPANPFSDGGEDGTPYVPAGFAGSARLERVFIGGTIGTPGATAPRWAIASKDPVGSFLPANPPALIRDVVIDLDV